MTELTHLLGCELTPVEKSLIGFGESRGSRLERERIIKLLEDRLTQAKDTNESFGQITAMRIPVEFDQLEAITEAIIYLIKGEQR